MAEFIYIGTHAFKKSHIRYYWREKNHIHVHFNDGETQPVHVKFETLDHAKAAQRVAARLDMNG